MIFKKKNKNFFKKYFDIFKNFSALIVIFQLLIIFFLFGYYYSSALSHKIPFDRVKNKIFKVVGFDYHHLKTLPSIYKSIFLSYFEKNNLDTIDISLNQKSLIDLDIQRKSRLNKEDFKTWSYVNAKLNYKDKTYKIKVRPRGARQLHYINFNEMSLRVDMRGDNYFQGMEEFNLHKPLLRNYIHEWIFHKILNENKIFSPKYSFINLKINGSPRGVFAIEETFSKELIERNNKRFGPVFEFDSKVGVFKSPEALISVYNKKFWVKNDENKKILSQATFILENFLKDDTIFDQHVDIEKWAKFFAITDLTRAYHGTVKHSVRYFFNPVTSKVEPVPFDGHIGTGDFESFYLLDFLKEDTKGCYWICYDKPFFQKFFLRSDGTLRSQFLKTYLSTLNKISDEEFLNNFFNRNDNYINKLNSLFYRENSKKDLIFYKSISRYFFEKAFYYDRAQEIRERINTSDLKNSYRIIFSNKNNNYKFINRKNGIPVFLKSISCKINELGSKDKLINQYFYLDQILKIENNLECSKATFVNIRDDTKVIDIDNFKKNSINLKKKFNDYRKISIKKIINKNLNLNKDLNFDKNSKLIINSNVTVNLNGNNIFINGKFDFRGDKNNEIKVIGPGSLIFNYANGKIRNTKFYDLTEPNLFGYTLYSGLNFLNSNVFIDNVTISDINIEDAINFVSSKAMINDIYFSNIAFDALDSDFSILEFNKIKCYKVQNDCLDTSSSNVKGILIEANEIGDKALSLGEQSDIDIKNININNAHLGIAIKDGSKVKIGEASLNHTKFDIAIYKKKEFFLRNTLLDIDSTSSEQNDKKFYILKNDTSVFKTKNKINAKVDIRKSDEIFKIVTQ